MQIITISSRYAVRHFREILECAWRGAIVLITHYKRARVAVIPIKLLDKVLSKQDTP